MKRLATIIAAAFSLLFATAAGAQVRFLDFEGIAPYPNNNSVQIADFYNGGTSSIGTSGPNLGVQFTSSAILLCLNTVGATCSNTSRGGQGISTSQRGALFFPDANPIMNVAAGFDTGFAGVFSNPNGSATSISIFGGLNGTGALLASLSLPATANGTTACPNFGALYCPFSPFSLTFAGTARSVLFGGTANQQVFDDLTFGSASVGGVVPEPAAWAMMILGFGVIGGALRRRGERTAYAA